MTSSVGARRLPRSSIFPYNSIHNKDLSAVKEARCRVRRSLMGATVCRSVPHSAVGKVRGRLTCDGRTALVKTPTPLNTPKSQWCSVEFPSVGRIVASQSHFTQPSPRFSPNPDNEVFSDSNAGISTTNITKGFASGFRLLDLWMGVC